MKNERDILIKNAYPELKTYCKEKYNLEFQVPYFNKIPLILMIIDYHIY